MAGIGESLTDELYLKLAEQFPEKGSEKQESARSTSFPQADTNVPQCVQNQYSEMEMGVGRQRGRGRGRGKKRGRGFSRDRSLDQRELTGREPHQNATENVPMYQRRSHSVQSRNGNRNVDPDCQKNYGNHGQSWRPMMKPDQNATENIPMYQRRSHSVQSRNGNRNVDPDWQKNDGNQGQSPRPMMKQTRQIGFKGLQNLTSKTSSDVVATLANRQYGFEELLKSCIQPDLMIVIMQILVKVCDHDFTQLKTSILIHTCCPNFLEQIEQHLSKMPAEDSGERKSSMKSFIINLLQFYEAIMNIFPNTASEKFKKLFIHTDVIMRGVEDYQSIDLKEPKEKFYLLKKQLDNLIEERTRKGIKESSVAELRKYQPPPDDFRGKDIFPAQEDLFRKAPFIRPNIKEGAYFNVDHYLDIQFRLLREDFVRPLREAVMNYVEVFVQNKSKKRIENVRIYRKVNFGNPKLVNDQLGIRVNFDPERKLRKVKWEFSKRFMYGALLCFTNDNFKSVVFGTVAEREIKKLTAGMVTVVLHESVEKSMSILSSECVMLESQVYFEPYKLVLKALQDMDENSFPMQKYIISVEKEVCHPHYLQAGTCVYDICSHKVSVWNEESWPDASNLGLDPSQYDAFKAALIQEFVVIQGPPGTGKTFLGLKVASVLLNNPEPWNAGRTPILVVCFTNHALDQFLEGLLPVTQSIVRVGGQSKSMALAHYNLKERRRTFSKTFANRFLQDDLHTRMARIFTDMKQIQVNVEEIEMNRGIISLKTFNKAGIIQDYHLTSFGAKDERLCDWLLENFDNFVATGLQREGAENVNNEDTPVEDIIEDENEAHWHKIDLDHQFFDASKVMSSLNYTLDVQMLEEQKNQLEKELLASERDAQENPNSLPRFYEFEYQFNNANEKVLYWKALLEQKHNADPGYIMQLNARRNVWHLPPNDRWILYKSWVSSYKKCLLKEMQQHEVVYRELAHQFEEVKQLADLEIMKSSLVVGMTTTNAARLQPMLQALKSKIVIVEEAAEVIESHIVVSLTNKCEHLILIGDHKQLRPNTSVYELARHYFFDISLFERMVNNGMHCYCLNVQHRMRPEIARLIVPAIYPVLNNHESVMKYPEVLGVKKSLFFITHTKPEEEVDDIMSHKNAHEAKFILELCRYLVLQGYAPDEITVLSTYKGQMFYMKNLQKNNMDILADVKITVVDNFQGEENRIILLSLVRSNKDNKIGFLNIENRVCVALSRAREGLYIIGNMENLEEASKIWPKIKEVLLEQQAFASYLTLKCQIHPDQETEVSTADDFKKVPEGGCSLPCKATLLCGHECKSVCHVNNRDHREYKCQRDCQRSPPECPFGHSCPNRCYQECGKCETILERLLPCKHVKCLACHVDHNTYKCLETVKVALEKCGHEVNKPCYEDPSTFPCPFPCEDRLQCGHSCLLLCHPLKDPDHLEYKCNKPCARKNAGCSMDHLCVRKCFEECGDCGYEVEKKLPSCGHKHQVTCSLDPSTITCKRKCKRMLPCGHFCKRLCYQPCGGCVVMVTKVIPSCGHEIQTKCSLDPNPSMCRKPCKRKLECAHLCTKTCGDSCIASDCREIVSSPIRPICGHEIKIPCFLKTKVQPDSRALLEYCKSPCTKVLACGHQCVGSCGKCAQGRIHTPCGQKCERSLICGHSCRVPCSESCPPCSLKCEYKCKHSKCPNKCGAPCYLCKEKCDWKCEHKRCSKFCHDICDRDPCYEPCKKKLKKCGHPCIGFCGDPCPPLCGICDEEEVKEIFFGTENEDNARFVFLVDCKHTFESGGLEMWFKKSDEEITLKTCPRCKSYVRHTPRFMQYVKLSLKDVVQVKDKVFGNPAVLEAKKQSLREKLNKLLLPPFVAHSITISSLYFKMLNTCKISLFSPLDVKKSSSGKRLKFLSQTETDYIATQIEILEDLLATLKANVVSVLKPHLENKLYENFEFLVERLIQRNGKISPQETSDFNQECKRFQRITQLIALENSVADNSVLARQEVKVLLEEARSLAYSIIVYSEETERRLKEVLEKLKIAARVSLALTDRERREIVQATGLKQGHWFKCPNGHVYCIGECGGAVVEATCPQCGERIGGSNHRLLTTNRLASEMDGATRHAWPGGLY